MYVIEYDDKGRTNIGDIIATVIYQKIQGGGLERQDDPIFGMPNWKRFVIEAQKGKNVK